MAENSKQSQDIFMGIVPKNYTFRLALAMCPALTAATALSGLGLGLATMAVLTLACLVISCLRRIIPQNVRILVFFLVAASFTAMAQMLILAYYPALARELKIGIPLVAVSCVFFAGAEPSAFSDPPVKSFLSGLWMGVGFTLAVTLLASVREFLGMGSFFGTRIFPQADAMILAGQAPGGFILLGLFMAVADRIVKPEKPSQKEGKA